MGKKNLTKSSDQKESLELFYRRKPSGWKREEIVQISSSLGLSRQQVYKWLWDRKKLSCARIKRICSFIQNNITQWGAAVSKAQLNTMLSNISNTISMSLWISNKQWDLLFIHLFPCGRNICSRWKAGNLLGIALGCMSVEIWIFREWSKRKQTSLMHLTHRIM